VETKLQPGTWYFAVRAVANANARYRLKLSTGFIQDLDLNGGAKILWQGLQGYLERFRGDAKAKKSLDAKVVRAFLNAVN